MYRFLADENLDHAIVRGLLLRHPELIFAIAQSEGLAGLPDREVLDWAAERGAIVITHDAATFPETGYQFLSEGLSFPGIIVCPRRLAVGCAIDDLTLMVEASEQSEWKDRVTFLPL